MAFVAAHDAPDDLTIDGPDQEQLRVDPELARDIPARVIPRCRQSTGLPKGRDGVGIIQLE